MSKKSGFLQEALRSEAWFGYVLIVCAVLLCGMIWGTYFIEGDGALLPEGWLSGLHDLLMLVGSACTFAVGWRFVVKGHGLDKPQKKPPNWNGRGPPL